MTRSAWIAVIASLAVHALLIGAAGGFVFFSSGPDVVAELDLSSVELSFSEEESETEPVPLMAAAVPAEATPTPRAAEAPAEVKVEKRLPPDPEALRLREPEEPIGEMSEPPQEPEPPAKKEDVRPHEPEPPKPSAPAAVPSRPAPRQAHVDAPPQPRRTIRPRYPKGARQRGEEGRVVLEIDVGSDGACTAVRVAASSGFAELDEAAVNATRSARFTPAKSNGRAVASTARLALDFRLK